MPEPADLCAVCQKAFSQFRRWGGVRPSVPIQNEGVHHETIVDLKAAGQAGCPICAWVCLRFARECENDLEVREFAETDISRFFILWRGLRRSGWYDGEAEPEDVDHDMENTMELSVEVIFDGVFEPCLVDFKIEITMASPVNHAMQGYERDDYTGSSESFNLISGWLEECQASHSLCHGLRIEHWRPARLIHSSTSLDGKLVAVELHEAARDDYTADVRYMTLSHRWTNEAQTILQKSNVDQLRTSIAYGKLKGAVQDALLLARHLGCEYLWVDTLCIVQDDPDELGRQIQEMDKVYTNALCNIAASDAKTNNEGCFFARDSALVRTYHVQLDADSSSHARHLLRPTRDETQIALGSCVLESRAWVFQERLLAPRAVHCCATQLYWKCREMEASETHPSGVIGGRRLKVVFGGESVDTSKSMNKEHNLWSMVVSEYTRRALTYPEDKLNALTGISTIWQRLYGGEYLGGLWRSMLPAHLLWKLSDAGPSLRVPYEKSVAPSWSWASVNGLVDLGLSGPAHEQDSLVRLVSGDQGRSSRANTWSHIALHLLGHVAQASWVEDSGHEDFPGEPRYLLSRSRSAVEHAFLGNDNIYFDDRTQPLPEIVCCLPVHRMFYGPPERRRERIIGLILMPTPEDDRRFLRLGYFDIQGQDMLEHVMAPSETVIELV